MIELQNCMDEIAEGFNVISKNRNKKLLYEFFLIFFFLFLSGILV